MPRPTNPPLTSSGTQGPIAVAGRLLVAVVLCMSVVTAYVVLTGASSKPVAGAAAVTPQTTQGTDFWVTFEQNYDGASTLYLFATGNSPATGTVSAPVVGFPFDSPVKRPSLIASFLSKSP